MSAVSSLRSSGELQFDLDGFSDESPLGTVQDIFDKNTAETPIKAIPSHMTSSTRSRTYSLHPNALHSKFRFPTQSTLQPCATGLHVKTGSPAQPIQRDKLSPKTVMPLTPPLSIPKDTLSDSE